MPSFTAFPTSSFHPRFISDHSEDEYVSTSYYLSFERWPRISGSNSGLAPTPMRSAWFPDAPPETATTLKEGDPHPEHIVSFSASSAIIKQTIKPVRHALQRSQHGVQISATVTVKAEQAENDIVVKNKVGNEIAVETDSDDLD